MIADHFHISKVSLEASLEKYENVLFIGNHLTLLLHSLLLNSQLLDPIGDLVSDPSEATSDFLVVLQHKQILVDSLKKVLSKLFDFLSIDDVAFE